MFHDILIRVNTSAIILMHLGKRRNKSLKGTVARPLSMGELLLQDLVFVVEKLHEVFRREGNDLVCMLKVGLVEALTHEATISTLFR